MEHVVCAIHANIGHLACTSNHEHTYYKSSLMSNILAKGSAEAAARCRLKETQAAGNLLLPQYGCDDRHVEHEVGTPVFCHIAKDSSTDTATGAKHYPQKARSTPRRMGGMSASLAPRREPGLAPLGLRPGPPQGPALPSLATAPYVLAPACRSVATAR
ncbi:unnamed protein product [Prorocentrum cordatum]|uniref:Uncharacterized protein n=1 Tax=Prorocentrum cordatum TaxID=2364126 RepID=A0ABN9XA33_9DINO|nr:unnamed protein product [Polarella glacialis]